jgi:hypothetical protein
MDIGETQFVFVRHNTFGFISEEITAKWKTLTIKSFTLVPFLTCY